MFEKQTVALQKTLIITLFSPFKVLEADLKLWQYVIAIFTLAKLWHLF